MRRLLLIVTVLAFPLSAMAGPKEDAQAVFDKFLTEFTAANLEGVVGVFWPDAHFWGTTMTKLATTPGEVRQYFSDFSRFKPNERKATALGQISATAVSDSVVLLSGTWQVDRIVDGQQRLTPLRISLAVTKRGDRWAIAQFHNSPRPNPQ